ncbi:MAG: hypothetical protein IKO46_06175 [Salinivirgaceae bacterium]|nr:hypothetical protein [Salinivirgaceae bacterium]
METAEFFVLCLGVFMVLAGSAMLIIVLKDDEKDDEKDKIIDEACKWLERNDSYAVPTNLQVDRLREYLKHKVKGE